MLLPDRFNGTERWMVMGMSERCLHNEVCKYGEKRSNGMYCTEEKCKQFKNATTYVEVVRCKDCRYCMQDYHGLWCFNDYEHNLQPNDFCSRGEKKDGDGDA